jgi:hypothetical protein
VHADYPAAWSGWSSIALGGIVLAQLVLTGDALPASYHLAPLGIGIALLVA